MLLHREDSHKVCKLGKRAKKSGGAAVHHRYSSGWSTRQAEVSSMVLTASLPRSWVGPPLGSIGNIGRPIRAT